MSDEPFYAPGHKPAALKPRAPGEPLWQILANFVEWSAELHFRGESYGWEAQIYRDGDFFASRRFDLKAAAIGWANVQRGEIEKGWQQ